MRKFALRFVIGVKLNTSDWLVDVAFFHLTAGRCENPLARNILMVLEIFFLSKKVSFFIDLFVLLGTGYVSSICNFISYPCTWPRFLWVPAQDVDSFVVPEIRTLPLLKNMVCLNACEWSTSAFIYLSPHLKKWKWVPFLNWPKWCIQWRHLQTCLLAWSSVIFRFRTFIQEIYSKMKAKRQMCVD